VRNLHDKVLRVKVWADYPRLFVGEMGIVATRILPKKGSGKCITEIFKFLNTT